MRRLACPFLTWLMLSLSGVLIHAAQPEWIELPQASLVVEDPGFPWKHSTKYDERSGATVLTFVRSFPESNLIVTAEHTGFTSLQIGDSRFDSFLSILKGSLAGVLTDVEFGKPQATPENGIDWIMLPVAGLPQQTNPSAGNTPTSKVGFFVFVAVHQGMAYRLTSSNVLLNEAKTDGRAFLNKIKYQPAAATSGRASPASTDGLPKIDDYHGKVHGFDTELASLGWKGWPRLKELVPHAFFGASHPQGGNLYVLVVPAPVADPGFIENVFALLRMTTRFGQPERLKSKPITLAGAESALEFEADELFDGTTLHFQGRVAQGHGRLTLMIAWGPLQALNASPRLYSSALDSIKLLEVEGLPAMSLFTPDQRRGQADVLNEIGLALHRQGNMADAARVFQQAIEQSAHNPLFAENAANCLDQIGDYASAIKVIERQQAREKAESKSPVLAQPRLVSLLARLHMANGEAPKALAIYESLFKEGCRDEETLIAYLAVLYEKEQHDTAIKLMDDFVKHHASQRTKRWQAMTRFRARRYDEALKLYAPLLETKPLDVEAANQYGECANAAGKHELSAKAAKLLLTNKVDTARTRLIEGWSLYGQKAFREARLSFEAAKAKEPNNPLVAEAITLAAAALGQGDTTAVREPITPLSLPADIRARLDKEQLAWQPPADTGAAYLERTTHQRFIKGKPFISTIRHKVKALDQAGVEAFTTLSIQFDPLRERVFVNHLEVRDEAGKVIATGKLDDQYVVDPSLEGIATLRRVLRVPVPGLKPGRTVDYTYTVQELAPADTMPYQNRFCSSPYPIAIECIVLEGDVEKASAVGNAEFNRHAEALADKGPRVWLVRNPVAYRMEPELPRYDTYLPELRFGAAGRTWKEVGAEYLKIVDAAIAQQPEMKPLALELTKDLTTPEAKAEALSKYVRQEITYKAIEFGRRAMVPNAPTRILANHYGDCKDQSLLLHQLLTAVGIESFLVLANTHTDLTPELPDLDQFNHMIVHVPSLKCRFIDCTEGKAASTTFPPYLFDRQVFIIDKANPRLMAMPKRTDFEPNRFISRRVVKFDSEGSATVDETLELHAYLGNWMRSMLQSIEPEKRVDYLQRYMQRRERWQLDKVSATNLDTPTKPLILVMRYALPPRGTRAVAEQRYIIPALWENDYLEPAYVKARRHPFEHQNPISWLSDVTVTLPGPVDSASLADFNQQQKQGEFVTWKTLVTLPTAEAPHQFRLTSEGNSPPGTHKPERYSDMHREMMSAISCWDQDVRGARGQ